MKKTLFFVAIVAMFTLTSCGMGGGNQPVMVEEVEAVEVDSIPLNPQPDTTVVKVDTTAKKVDTTAKKVDATAKKPMK